ncbi:two-component system, OmpR family, alkaline phosphatase synthesis response regulator PhoP [Thermoanaerobacter thermohydrosulfuricus]|uniref:Stage 0 sporulation protein A homolog n=3 Tax=Thermoanaerobacter TaxID=1754 RepID=I9KVF2_9THEO|nr:MULTISPECIES: response regulator transcription factor [Thermoanaerobacter]EGD50840.1 two component transcriptional regulator, winged helix family [Thermoanaerobacter ethanolicus JW 200]HHY80370.1 response regulator transcription factor [Thermoanaerobacter sp.]AEM78994.1 two component transcriptional regulator, winged helix family [Thermoanaerobacter wiegelii Rt8.B1]EIW00891.1 response regulator with CheY-like receiver domain and winged-helix DNA-binding domain [Thermoanaerobacter siderophilu
MAHTVLVIEDEIHILELLRYNLEAAGYKVITSENGKEGLDKALEGKPDLVILDLMLPDVDGLEICKILKKNDETKNIPIIMLTAKSEEFDKVLGLELGADDYITKPFSVRELLARIKAVLRRTQQPEEEKEGIIKFGDIVIDTGKHLVYKKGKVLELTLKEFELLKLLSQNMGKVLTRDYLLDKVWGYEYAGETRTVDVHIRHLRKKIEDDDKSPVYIETVRGIGYKLKDKGEV